MGGIWSVSLILEGIVFVASVVAKLSCDLLAYL